MIRAKHIGIITLLVCYSSVTFAVGYRLPNQDPEAIARGNAFVATADNPSAVYHNPAGITQLSAGSHLSVGTYLISANVDFESNSPGVRGETDESIQVVPQLHYVHNIEESNVSLGLGLYAPYGLGVEWDGDPFTSLAQKGELKYATLNPVIAYQLSPSLSLAGGITVNFSEVDLTREIGILPDDEFNVRGEGRDIGFNLGALWRINSKIALGASYRSETEIEFDGESRATSSPLIQDYIPTSGTLLFPQFLDVGVSFRPYEDWLLEINLDWTDWNAVDISIFEDTALGDLPFPLNYKSSLMYEFGATKTLAGGKLFSVGYIFSENSVPSQDFTPFNPVGHFHLGSVGLSSRHGEIGWSVGYHFAYNSGRDVTDNQAFSLLGDSADGRYETFNHAVNLAVRFSF